MRHFDKRMLMATSMSRFVNLLQMEEHRNTLWVTDDSRCSPAPGRDPLSYPTQVAHSGFCFAEGGGGGYQGEGDSCCLPISSPCTLARVLVLGSSILLKVMMPWALWASYGSGSSAVKPGDLCPWDGPPNEWPVHPSIHPAV